MSRLEMLALPLEKSLLGFLKLARTAYSHPVEGIASTLELSLGGEAEAETTAKGTSARLGEISAQLGHCAAKDAIAASQARAGWRRARFPTHFWREIPSLP
jgi:hypothetical protein